MTTLTRRPLIALALVSAMLAAGCSNAPTRFYVLAPGEMTAVTAPALSVGLGPIGLAGYLDRPQIVTRPAADSPLKGPENPGE